MNAWQQSLKKVAISVKQLSLQYEVSAFAPAIASVVEVIVLGWTGASIDPLGTSAQQDWEAVDGQRANGWLSHAWIARNILGLYKLPHVSLKGLSQLPDWFAKNG